MLPPIAQGSFIENKRRSPLFKIRLASFCSAVILAAVFIVGSPRATLAASLSLTPSSSAYSVGQVFTVPVYVATASGQSMNAVSATVSYSSKLIDLVSVDKGGSIIDFWIKEPKVGESIGSVSFEAGVYNPGYSGARGKIVTLSFRAKSVGSATLSFTNASVLANDGQGTNILDRTGTASITITPAAPAPSITPSPSAVPEVKPVAPSTPRLNTIPASITPHDVLQINGSADPNNEITVYLRSSAGVIARQSTASDAAGHFSITWSSTFTPDAYAITAEAKNSAGLTSPRSADVTLFVREPAEQTVFPPLFILIILGILLATLIIVGIAWLWYLIHKVAGWRKLLRSQVKTADRNIHKHFEDLKEGITDHVQALEREAGIRELTSNEEAIVKDMNKYLRTIEEAVEREVGDIDG